MPNLRMKLRFTSIRKKLQLIVIAATLTALLLTLIGNVAGDLWLYYRTVSSELSSQSSMLVTTAGPLLRAEPAQVEEQFRQLKSSVLRAGIYNAQGQLLATHFAPGATAHLPASPGATGMRVEGRELVYVEPVFAGLRIVGYTYLSADYDLDQTVIEDTEIAVVVALLALAIALLLTRRLEKLVTGPIIGVARTVRDVVEQQDYSRRVERDGNDEVGTLVDSFNDMLAVVERRTALLEASNRSLAQQGREREDAQREVLQLNVGLEMRVRERTAQLEESNRNLELARAAAEEARAAAEDANQAKSAFLSSMSHELRTPLNSILGFGQLLSSDMHPEEHRKEFTAYIMKAGTHLLTLVNEILDLAKVESGTLMLSLEPVALAELMADCEAMVAPLADQRQIALHLPEQVELVAQADRTRLKQVLLNLLSNAIKYNRAGGSVRVECRAGRAGRVRIGVCDSGQGLGPAQMEKLFQPFNRLGQESGAEEGTGIGLTVTQRLVELMDGTIEARSTLGVGSEFWIDLPCAVVDASARGVADAAAPHPVPASLDAAAPTLLYVEDNPANLKLVEAIVGLSPQVRLLSAPDAMLGIQLARAHLPDLILMDINLPGMSGIEALAVLRADPATAHIPVLAVTASAMTDDLALRAAGGFFRYLTKPLDIDEFWVVVHAALDARKEAS
ncbi:MAG TPA: ATP-binding protein [Telluria sp.]|nr:ATP-binding protein [Telluria sp.]